MKGDKKREECVKEMLAKLDAKDYNGEFLTYASNVMGNLIDDALLKCSETATRNGQNHAQLKDVNQVMANYQNSTKMANTEEGRGIIQIVNNRTVQITPNGVGPVLPPSTECIHDWNYEVTKTNQ